MKRHASLLLFAFGLLFFASSCGAGNPDPPPKERAAAVRAEVSASVKEFFYRYIALERTHDPDLVELFDEDAVWEFPAIGHRVPCEGVAGIAPRFQLQNKGVTRDFGARNMARDELEHERQDDQVWAYTKIRQNVKGGDATIDALRTWGPNGRMPFRLKLQRGREGDWVIVGRRLQRECEH